MTEGQIRINGFMQLKNERGYQLQTLVNQGYKEIFIMLSFYASTLCEGLISLTNRKNGNKHLWFTWYLQLLVSKADQFCSNILIQKFWKKTWNVREMPVLANVIFGGSYVPFSIAQVYGDQYKIRSIFTTALQI